MRSGWVPLLGLILSLFSFLTFFLIRDLKTIGDKLTLQSKEERCPKRRRKKGEKIQERWSQTGEKPEGGGGGGTEKREGEKRKAETIRNRPIRNVPFPKGEKTTSPLGSPSPPSFDLYPLSLISTTT